MTEDILFDDEIYAGDTREIKLLADPHGSEDSALVLYFLDGSTLEVWPDGHLEAQLPTGQLVAFSLIQAIDNAETAIIIHTE